MKIINTVSRIMSYVATGLLLPMMVLTVVDVFLRFAFNSPITGTAELTKIMMVCLVLGLAWCALQRRHVEVDVVMKRFPPRVQAIVGSITLLIGLGTIIAITWEGFLSSVFVVMKHKYVASVMMPIPMFPFYWLFVLGCAMLCVALVPLLIQEVKGVFKG
jgi:TRAP-type C4-dicarboxylate transport system permease small subunit